MNGFVEFALGYLLGLFVALLITRNQRKSK